MVFFRYQNTNHFLLPSDDSSSLLAFDAGKRALPSHAEPYGLG